jgi:hypothetical protein
MVLLTFFAEFPSQAAHLDFETVGNKHFLSQIQTSDGVYDGEAALRFVGGTTLPPVKSIGQSAEDQRRP